MQSSSRESLLIFVAIGCVALFGGDRFVLTPLMAKWEANKKEIARLESELQRGDALIGRDRAIDRQWRQMQNRSLVGERNVAASNVLEAMGNWAVASRLHIPSYTPRWVDAKDDSRYEVQIAGEGTLAAIARFVYELERDPIAVRLEDLEMRAKDDRGQELTMRARISGLILPEPAEAAPKTPVAEAN